VAYATVFNPYEILGFHDGEDSYCGLLVWHHARC